MPKSKYQEWLTPEGLVLIEGWARDGLTLEQIAGNLGVARQTLADWAVRYPNIGNALKKGRDVADYIVENALFKRATGFQYDEITEEPVTDADGLPLLDEDGQPVLRVSKRVIKFMAPDTGAAAFWLKNRRRDRWRDRWEDAALSQTAAGGGVVMLPEVDDDG